jgi:hypothetical protein
MFFFNRQPRRPAPLVNGAMNLRPSCSAVKLISIWHQFASEPLPKLGRPCAVAVSGAGYSRMGCRLSISFFARLSSGSMRRRGLDFRGPVRGEDPGWADSAPGLPRDFACRATPCDPGLACARVARSMSGVAPCGCRRRVRRRSVALAFGGVGRGPCAGSSWPVSGRWSEGLVCARPAIRSAVANGPGRPGSCGCTAGVGGSFDSAP